LLSTFIHKHSVDGGVYQKKKNDNNNEIMKEAKVATRGHHKHLITQIIRQT